MKLVLAMVLTLTFAISATAADDYRKQVLVEDSSERADTVQTLENNVDEESIAEDVKTRLSEENEESDETEFERYAREKVEEKKKEIMKKQKKDRVNPFKKLISMFM